MISVGQTLFVAAVVAIIVVADVNVGTIVVLIIDLIAPPPPMPRLPLSLLSTAA